MSATRDVILNVVTRLKEERGGGSSSGGGGLEKIKKRNRELKKATRKTDELRKAGDKIRNGSGRTPLLDAMQKKINGLLNKIGSLATQLKGKLRAVAPVVNTILKGLGAVARVIKAGLMGLVRFAGPIAAIAAVAVGMWKWLTHWQNKNNEALEKGKKLDEIRLQYLQRRVGVQKAYAAARNRRIDSSVKQGDFAKAGELAEEGIGSGQRGIEMQKEGTQGLVGAIGVLVSAYEKLKSVQQAAAESNISAMRKRLEMLQGTIGLLKEAMAIREREKKQNEDIRVRLAMMSPARRKVLAERQARLSKGEGTRADAIAVQREGGTKASRRKLLEDVESNDPLVKAFTPDRSKEDQKTIFKADIATFATGSKTYAEAANKLSKAVVAGFKAMDEATAAMNDASAQTDELIAKLLDRIGEVKADNSAKIHDQKMKDLAAGKGEE